MARISGEELRVALTSMRSTFAAMQEQIEGEPNLDFADQMIYESEVYLMGEVIKLFNKLDEEDVDWGEVNREYLALKLQETFVDSMFDLDPTKGAPLTGPATKEWLAVADKAIEILVEGRDASA